MNPFSVDLLKSLQITIGEHHDDSAAPESASSAFEERLLFELSSPATCLAVAADTLAYDQGSQVIVRRQEVTRTFELAAEPISAIALSPNYLGIAYNTGPLVVVDLSKTDATEKLWEFSTFCVTKAKWHPSKPQLGASGSKAMVFKDVETLTEATEQFQDEIGDFEFLTEAVVICIGRQTVTVLNPFTYETLHEFTASGLNMSTITSFGLYSSTRLLLIDAQQSSVMLYDLASTQVVQRSVMHQSLTFPIYCVASRQVVFHNDTEMLVVEMSPDLCSLTQHTTYRFNHPSKLLAAAPSSLFAIYSISEEAVYSVQLKAETYTTPVILPCIKPEVSLASELRDSPIITEESQEEAKSAEVIAEDPELKLEEAKLDEAKLEEAKVEAVKPDDALKPEDVKAEEVKADEAKTEESKKARKRKKNSSVTRSSRNKSPKPEALPELKPPDFSHESLQKATEAKVLEMTENVLRGELKVFEKKIEAVQTRAQTCIDKLSSTVQSAAQSIKSKQADRDIRGMIRQVVIEAVSEQFSRVIVPKFEERLQSFFGNLTLQFEASLKEQAERTAIEESKLQSINSHLVSVIETEKALEKNLNKGIAKHLGRMTELESQIAEIIRSNSGIPQLTISNLPELRQHNPLKSQLDELLTKGRYEEAIQLGVDQADTGVLIEVMQNIDPQALALQVTLSDTCRAQLLGRLLECLQDEARIEDYYSWVELCCARPFKDKKQALKTFERLSVLAASYPRLVEAKERLLNSLVS